VGGRCRFAGWCGSQEQRLEIWKIPNPSAAVKIETGGKKHFRVCGWAPCWSERGRTTSAPPGAISLGHKSEALTAPGASRGFAWRGERVPWGTRAGAPGPHTASEGRWGRGGGGGGAIFVGVAGGWAQGVGAGSAPPPGRDHDPCSAVGLGGGRIGEHISVSAANHRGAGA